MTRRPATALAVAAALLVPVALAACSDDDDDDGGGDSSETTTAGSSAALPPVIVDIASLDGGTVDVPLGQTIDLTGDDETYLDWTAEIADPAIVSFTPGRDDGDAQFNPGLEATEVGSTEVTMTNSSSGDTITFTVNVTEA